MTYASYLPLEVVTSQVQHQRINVLHHHTSLHLQRARLPPSLPLSLTFSLFRPTEWVYRCGGVGMGEGELGLTTTLSMWEESWSTCSSKRSTLSSTAWSWLSRMSSNCVMIPSVCIASKSCIAVVKVLLSCVNVAMVSERLKPRASADRVTLKANRKERERE